MYREKIWSLHKKEREIFSQELKIFNQIPSLGYGIDHLVVQLNQIQEFIITWLMVISPIKRIARDVYDIIPAKSNIRRF
jgi:hypothetical protein